MKIFIAILLIIAGSGKIFSQVDANAPGYPPVAVPTVFLDFDGEQVSASPWNWNGEIHAAPCSAPPATILEIMTRVKIDFSIFNLNITTDSTAYFAAPFNKRLRIIVTPTYEWYGQSGGASFIGSFTWGDDTPAWVFSTVLGNNPKYIAEAISHEIGHTLGLQHHSAYDENCNKTYEYHPGVGDGLTGWAPIMGEGYSRNMTTWARAPNPEACNLFQDDLEIIRQILELLPDDYGDSPLAASPLPSPVFSRDGMVNAGSDVDWFAFTLQENSIVSLQCISEAVGSPGTGTNLHAGMAVYRDNILFCRIQNPDNPSCSLDTTLPAGRYYISVEGVGNRNMNDYSSLGRYTLSGTASTALPVYQVNLRGKTNGNEHLLNWKIVADEAIVSITLEHSDNGEQYSILAVLPPNKNVFHWKPPVNGKYFYRLRVKSASGTDYVSNVIIVQPYSKFVPRVIHNSSQGFISVFYEIPSEFKLIGSSGQLLGSGRNNTGQASIVIPPSYRGLIVLQLTSSAGSYQYKLVRN